MGRLTAYLMGAGQSPDNRYHVPFAGRQPSNALFSPVSPPSFFNHPPQSFHTSTPNNVHFAQQSPGFSPVGTPTAAEKRRGFSARLLMRSDSVKNTHKIGVSRTGKSFHRLGCHNARFYHDIHPEDEDTLLPHNYKPCGICKPDQTSHTGGLYMTQDQRVRFYGLNPAQKEAMLDYLWHHYTWNMDVSDRDIIFEEAFAMAKARH